MSQIKCEVYIGDIVRHISQIVSGFIKLGRKESFSVKLTRDHSKTSSGAYLFAEINGSKVIYDLYDNRSIDDNHYSRCDFYFKRSFIKDNHESYSKVYPLGFYFAIADYFKELHPLKYSVQNTAGALLGRKIHLCEKEILADPFISPAPKTLFIPRLWDPDAPDIENNYVSKERVEINEFRIACVKECRDKFPDSFIGGIQPTEYALEHLGKDSPLIMEKAQTIRGRYINIMKSTDICVSTQGLHRSNPGKIAEYIAASRAIVSEPLYYGVTGDFAEGKNFLSFATVDELISSISTLLDDHEFRHEMMKANQNYRDKYALTEKIVENSIETVTAARDFQR